MPGWTSPPSTTTCCYPTNCWVTTNMKWQQHQSPELFHNTEEDHGIWSKAMVSFLKVRLWENDNILLSMEYPESGSNLHWFTECISANLRLKIFQGDAPEPPPSSKRKSIHFLLTTTDTTAWCMKLKLQ